MCEWEVEWLLLLCLKVRLYDKDKAWNNRISINSEIKYRWVLFQLCVPLGALLCLTFITYKTEIIISTLQNPRYRTIVPKMPEIQ